MSLIKPGPRKGPQGVTVQDNTPALSHQKKTSDTFHYTRFFKRDPYHYHGLLQFPYHCVVYRVPYIQHITRVLVTAHINNHYIHHPSCSDGLVFHRGDSSLLHYR